MKDYFGDIDQKNARCYETLNLLCNILHFILWAYIVWAFLSICILSCFCRVEILDSFKTLMWTLHGFWFFVFNRPSFKMKYEKVTQEQLGAAGAVVAIVGAVSEDEGGEKDDAFKAA